MINIIKQLEQTASRNEKIAILLQNSQNETLKQVFNLALNPFIQFFIRKIPNYVELDTKIDLNAALAQLAVLSNREKTGNAAIGFLSDLLGKLTADDAEIVKRIINKDLACGVQASTVNKVWPKLIPEYAVMLCTAATLDLLSKFRFPAIAQVKKDGMRFNAIVKNGKVEYRSRNGKLIDLFDKFDESFINMSQGCDIVFDGELCIQQNEGVANRQTGNGILNKAIRGTITREEVDLVKITLWDMLSLADQQAGWSNIDYARRWESLGTTYFLHGQSSSVELVKSQTVNSKEEALSLFQEYVARGEEGIVLKDTSGLWEDKRVKTQLKLKSELDCDLKVIGYTGGTGKYTGMLGALECESADGVLKVAIGGGFSDEQRKTIGLDIIGKIITVKYNGKIRNKDGGTSLFLPRFKEIRHDKDVADVESSIKEA